MNRALLKISQAHFKKSIRLGLTFIRAQEPTGRELTTSCGSLTASDEENASVFKDEAEEEVIYLGQQALLE